MKETVKKIVKTGNFQADVRAGYYQQERNEPFRSICAPWSLCRYNKTTKRYEGASSWDADFANYLLASGVPEKYASKVASLAYQQGHANGYVEILGCAAELIDIFSD